MERLLGLKVMKNGKNAWKLKKKQHGHEKFTTSLKLVKTAAQVPPNI